MNDGGMIAATPNDAITIRRALPREEGGRINLFYASRGYLNSVDGDVAVYIAEHGGIIIGVVRLCAEEGHAILRTMHVHQEYRGRGIGRRLLEAFREEIRAADCYCIPFAHLVGFYGAIGFRRIDPQEAPPHLQERLREYLARGMDGIIMKREKDGGCSISD